MKFNKLIVLFMFTIGFVWSNIVFMTKQHEIHHYIMTNDKERNNVMFFQQDFIVSVIFTVRNAGIDLYMALETMKVCHSGYDYEVIIVDEGSVDGCCDFLLDYNFAYPIKKVKATKGANARHLGASQARGDYYIFCSPRLYFDDGWMTKLIKPLVKGKVWAVSPLLKAMGRNERDITSCLPYGFTKYIDQFLNGPSAQVVPTLSQECFAISAEAYLDVGGFDFHFNNKQIEIYEFSMRIWLFGGSCYYEPSAVLTSVFRVNFPEDSLEKSWGEDLLLMAKLHFNETRYQYCQTIVKSYFIQYCKPQEVTEKVIQRRQYYEARRCYDDDWYCHKFEIDKVLMHAKRIGLN